MTRISDPLTTCQSLDRAFQRISLRPGPRLGAGSLKDVAAPPGVNASLRSALPASSTTTEVRCAACPKLISTTGGDTSSTAPLFGLVPETAVWAVAGNVICSRKKAAAGRPPPRRFTRVGAFFPHTPNFGPDRNMRQLDPCGR